MVSQQHNNIHWPEEEISSSLEPTGPASSRHGWNLWLRLLGVGIALMTGFAPKFLPLPGEAGWNLFLLLVVLTGVVSAALLRSWWALLIVPVAFNLGHALGYGFEWFVPTLVSLIAVFFMVLVEIGVFIGTPLGAMIERRLRRSGKAFEEMDRNRIAR